MKIWKLSVTLEVPARGEYRVVWSALEALDCLMSNWRGDGGVLHRQALNACLAVLDNGRPTDFARDAFIAAADESHIAIRPPRSA
ncbi:DUF982 domain-containing protein [Rhizobium tubonense]|nr:DUF982 domain-containing protein [Rhizobium tubonense]